MPTQRTICTECKSIVTLAEPAEVGDVVPCPKCEAYFEVPKTRAKPATPAAPAAAKTAARPVAQLAKPKPKPPVDEDEDEAPPRKRKPVDDDEENDDTPRRKRKAAAQDDEDDEDEDYDRRPKGKKKKRRDDDDEERSYRNSPLRFIILGVLLVVLAVGAFLLYKKEWVKPDLVIDGATEDEMKKPIVLSPPVKKR